MMAALAVFGGISLGVYAVLPTGKFRNENKFDAIIMAKSQKYDVPFVILKGLIAVESAFDPNAKAPTSSATGLTQVIKGTAEGMGYDHSTLVNPEISIDAGANYLSQQMREFGTIGGIMAYYSGPNIHKLGTRLRFNTIGNLEKRELYKKIFKDSQKYVRKVMGYAARFAIDDLQTWG